MHQIEADIATSLQHYHALCRALSAYDRVLVAYSGGTDSTLLLKAALDTLGAEQVQAVMVHTPAIPAYQVSNAQRMAALLHLPVTISVQPLPDDPRFLDGPLDRCYWCKRTLFGALLQLAHQQEIPVVLDGENADDAGDWRPGRRAARELGVRSPLAEVGLAKEAIRAISRILGLPTWDTPAAACLVSRLPYGVRITEERLAMVGEAEMVLRDLGFPHVRVRHHEEIARIELSPEDFPRALQPTTRETITARLRTLGYRYVTLDLQGYRTGSMNPDTPSLVE